MAPAHLAARLNVSAARVVRLAERMPRGLYDPEGCLCDPERCPLCRSVPGRLSAMGAEAIIDLIDTKEGAGVIDVCGYGGWSAELEPLDDGTGGVVARAERAAVGVTVAVVQPVGGQPEVIVDGEAYSAAGARELSMALWEAARLAEHAA